MKLRNLQSLCAALLTLCPMLIHAQTSAVPNYISYQGFVVDASGNGVGAGTPVNRTVIFRIWDHQSSVSEANLIFSEQQTVTVSEGEFSVLVGQGVANNLEAFGYSETTKKLADLGDAFNGSGRYLGVTVASSATIATTDNEISPRQQIVSTAFAMRAKFAESISSSSDLRFSPTGGTVTNYGLGWYGLGRTFSGTAVDGPVLYGNAGGALGSNASDIQKTALLWDASGRVGIGATSFSSNTNKLTLQGDGTTPADQLTIRGNADNNKRLNIGYDTTNNKATLQSYTAADTTSPLLLNPSGGNVGINTNAPTVALDVDGAIAARGTLEVAGTVKLEQNVGIGRTPRGNNRLTIQKTIGGTDISFWQHEMQLEIRNGLGEESLGIGVMDNGHATLQAKESGVGYNPLHLNPVAGNVSIGASYATHGKLSVWGGPTQHGIYGTYVNGTTHGGAVHHGNHMISIFGEGSFWVGNALLVSSDKRIKDIEGKSDGSKDLQTLLGIDITDYRYKDQVIQGDNPQKKVIAQELEIVFPQAVSRQTNVIPDIYEKATIREDGWIELATDLKKGERVRLIVPEGGKILEVLEVEKKRFRTEFTPAEGEESLFVYGREVKDFRIVDYDAIATLNVSATQEIKKEKDAEIAALKAENAALRKQLADQAARTTSIEEENKIRDTKDESLEARLIALERRISKGRATETVSLRTAEVAE
ncbi:tail fiber domain-containing protein [Akkermansiaceae bacterium]|nr:tail fiber domain-containing protein [Akkermansiaceae bacterium]